MKLSLAVFCLVLCFPLLANGQPASPIATETNALPDGRVQLTIHNNSEVPLTAWLVTTMVVIDPTKGGLGLVEWHDVIVNPGTLSSPNKPILPGGEETFTYGVAFAHQPPPVVKLECAVFADGTSFGDQNQVQNIIERRRYALQLYGEVISILNEVATRDTALEQLSERFQAFREEHKKTAPDILYQEVANEVTTGVFKDVVQRLREREEPDRAVMSMVGQLSQRQSDLIKALPNGIKK